MKTLGTYFLLVALFGLAISCNVQIDKKDNKTESINTQKVEVYYFHFTRRCATCNAIEKVSKDAISEYYGDVVRFNEYNLDEPDGEKKSKELDVSGQSLLIVSGDTKINITNEGFMNARNNPDKFKKIIKENIDPLL